MVITWAAIFWTTSFALFLGVYTPMLFGHIEIGVLPRLVHSRFGLHAVEVVANAPSLEVGA